MREDEIGGWHHQFNGHEFEQALGDGEEERSLTCCSSWDHKELDTTEQQQILHHAQKVTQNGLKI